MANKYPTVTVRERGRAQPTDFQGGNRPPANRRQFKTGSAAGVPVARRIGRVPKSFLKPQVGDVVNLAVGSYLTTSLDASGRAIAGEDYSTDPAAFSGNFPIPRPDPNWETVWRCGAGGRLTSQASSGGCGFALTSSSSCSSISDAPSWPTTSFYLGDFEKVPNGTGCRSLKRAHLVRRSGQPGNAPVGDRVVAFQTSPLPLPMEVPFSFPVGNPTERPVFAPAKPGEEPSSPNAKPEPKPNPWAKPWTVPATWTAPGVAAPMQPGVKPRPGERVVVLPAMPTPVTMLPPLGSMAPGVSVAPPATVIQVQPGTGGVSVIRTGDFGQDSPPKPGQVQHKVTTKTRVIGLVWHGVGKITEGLDFVQAMHDSIKDPRKKLSKKASKAQVLEYMLTNLEPWGYIDPAEGLQNFINMQIGDYIAALGSDQIKAVNRMSGSTTGLDRAIRQHGKMISEQAEPGSQFNPVPELDIDAETGVISVSSAVGGVSVDLETLNVEWSKKQPKRR